MPELPTITRKVLLDGTEAEGGISGASSQRLPTPKLLC